MPFGEKEPHTLQINRKSKGTAGGLGIEQILGEYLAQNQVFILLFNGVRFGTAWKKFTLEST